MPGTDYSLFSDNFKIINEQPKRFFIKKGISNYSKTYKFTESKESTLSMTYESQSNKTTIHSTYYPSKEAGRLVDQFEPKTDTIVVLGFGLGYHIQKLAKQYPSKSIFVVEADKSLFNFALKNFSLEIFGENTIFIVGYDDYEVSDYINIGNMSFDLFIFRPMYKIFENYFDFIKKQLNKQAKYNFSDKWKYKKFDNQKFKILFIDCTYVLTRECLTAIEQAGHHFKYLHLEKEQYAYGLFVKKLLTEISDFKPDFLLTINHLGFDKEGRLTELLTELELPFASWFVDSPTVILSSYQKNISPFCNIFVWDQDYIDDVKNAGYHNVNYLPLAAQPEIFRNLNIQHKYDVSFVGSSMIYSIHKNLKRLVHRPDLLRNLEHVAEKFLQLDSRYVSNVIDILKASENDFLFDSYDQQADFEAAVLWRATQKYRLSGIKKLGDFNSAIFGDPNWDELLDSRFNIQRELLYYEEVPTLYNETRINFNMTSRQMKNAVNQRVFDVPACRQFILTDYKKQIEEVFEIGKEIICFNDIDEIPDLTRFYLKHSTLREKIAYLGYKKVIQKDTYLHRIQSLIETMKKEYQSHF